MSLLKRIWNDPVWSKVISAGIIYLTGSLVTAIINGKRYIEALFSFWNEKLPIWIYFIITALGVFIYRISRRKSISRQPTFGIFNKKVELPPGTIFDSAFANPHEYKEKEMQIWDKEKGNIGEYGRGNLFFNDNIITLHRSNKLGRFMIELRKYHSPEGKVSYVKRQPLGNAIRNFYVCFDCRIVGGKHHLIVLFKRNGSTSWLAHKGFDIRNNEWEKKEAYLETNNTEDFVIEFEDNYLEKEHTTLQIRNLKIKEIT